MTIVELRSIGSPVSKVIGATRRIVTIEVGFYPEVTGVFSLEGGIAAAVLAVIARGIRYFSCRSLLSVLE